MSRSFTHTVYQFDELNDKAKEKAREWYRALVFSDSSDWEFVFEDVVRMGSLIGIDIDVRSYQGSSGKWYNEPKIYFSGFSSQGDGACFEGSYRYAKGAVSKIKSETGFGFKCSDGTIGKGDEELIAIAQALQDVQRRHFYRLRATVKHSGHYSHKYCTAIDVEDCENPYKDLRGDDKVAIELLRDFMQWIYDSLQAEYDYRSSDEAVEEAIRANEYEFEEDGSRA